MADNRSELVRFRYEFSNAFRLAMDSIRSHKLRSFLTLLGVIIGVASVILVGSAIDGLGSYAEQSTAKAFGSDSFLVAQIAVAGNMTRRQFFDKLHRNRAIGQDDERFLETTTGDSVIYSPYRQKQADVKREDATSEDTTIIGVAAEMAQIRDIQVVEGRFFTTEEDRLRSYVAVIGEEVKTQLFPGGGSPLGKTVKLNGIDFFVIGVQEKLGSAFGRSQDKSMWIPATTFGRLFGPERNLTVFGRARPGSGLGLQESVDLARVALRTRFHARPGQPDNFDVLTPDAIRGFIDSVLSMIAAVVVPVTCISLVVGGIVIMNIMLVSVTERTREIGIRKSLGARRRDVLLQVLIEAVIMAVAGGAIGVGLGVVFTFVLSRVFQITLTITPFYVALALFVSSLVGIASGWYPAARASRLDPVEALRSE